MLLIGCGSSKPPVAATTLPATRPVAEAMGRSLFNGTDLTGWKASGFAGQPEPSVKDGCIVLPFGERLTGVTYDAKEAIPTTNYEITLEAKKVNGTDFFCGLTFPVDKSFASLIIGGWGGSVTGISSIDDYDAANNDTTKVRKFELNKWYTIRMRVTPKKLEAWVDDDQIVDADIEGKKISTRADIDLTQPLGIASYQTAAAIRNVRIRSVKN